MCCQIGLSERICIPPLTISTGSGGSPWWEPYQAHQTAASTRSDMIQGLFSRVSFFRQRAVALFHRTDQLKADSAERRERWNQVIAEHKMDQEKGTSTSSTGGGETQSAARGAPRGAAT